MTSHFSPDRARNWPSFISSEKSGTRRLKGFTLIAIPCIPSESFKMVNWIRWFLGRLEFELRAWNSVLLSWRMPLIVSWIYVYSVARRWLVLYHDAQVLSLKFKYFNWVAYIYISVLWCCLLQHFLFGFGT